MRTQILFLTMLAWTGCGVVANDDDLANDDDSGVTDDDDVSDDDDAANDDDAADDDDSAAPPCALQPQLDTLQTWTRVLGCGSATVSSARDADDLRVGVAMQLPGAPADSVGTTYALYFDDIDAKDEVPGSIVLEQGSALSSVVCTDTPGEAEVSNTWLAVSGGATLTVTGTSPGGFFATVTFAGVRVEDATGDRCALPDVEWTDVRLGWLPG